jgi:hypothetical protein
MSDQTEQDPNGRFLPPRRIYKITATKMNGSWYPVIDGKTYEDHPQSNKRECLEFGKRWADRIVKNG